VADVTEGLAAILPAMRKRRLALLVLLLAGTAPVLAHKLHVFAAADGAGIEGSAYFAGGGKAAGAKILITNAAGEVLAELKPAADGSFRYQARAPVEHRIIAETGDGHRAEWRVTAEELAGGFSPALAGAHTAAAEADKAASAIAAAGLVGNEGGVATASVLAPDLEAAIETAVARQIRPLREELLMTRDTLRLRDVLGGIGYIFGLAGLALWLHGRRLTGRG
jgi:nickel transport protein